MHLRSWPVTAIALFVTIGAPMVVSAGDAQDVDLRKLGGTWLYVEDRTEGRAVEDWGAPMSVKFALRVEKDGVVYPRSRGDERITLDGSVIEKTENGSVVRYSGEWKNGWLEYTQERVQKGDKDPSYILKRVFRVTDEGLLVYVFSNKSSKRVALYRHPEDIALPEPAKAATADMAWLADAWVGTRGTSSIEERWSPPKGDAMLGVSRTVKGDKMVAFEYLRIVQRDSGLAYVAQPGGNPPIEFTLIELGGNRAVFVNPRHDFPQRIVYELLKDGHLTISIGFAKGGRPQSFEFKRDKSLLTNE